jgi:hypothetical protein
MMKSIAELDHYEVLEVSRDARREEIERAFALVRGAYEGDALAAYSVIPPDEAKLWRERIDEAWRVLSDPEARRDYDAALDDAFARRDEDADPFAGMGDAVAAPVAEAAESAFADAGTPLERAPLPEAPTAAPTSLAAANAARPLRVEEPAEGRALPRELEVFDDADDAGAEWDGPRLRRARLVRGLEIDDVATATKINPTYLRFIEEERFGDLPAQVYVRGFVAAYARLLGLDPARVAPSYVARCEAQRNVPTRGRSLGRR